MLMDFIRFHPLLLFLVSFAMMLGTAWVGMRMHRNKGDLQDGTRQDFDVVLAATLTLLGLIIGFSFSMAISRYDQRKNLEEGEANAIGTAYVRADLLPAADGARLRPLLRAYLDQRVLYYIETDAKLMQDVNARTASLQNQIWATIQGPAVAQPTPITGLVVVSLNDVLNSQGYAQAAWLNRIPTSAWGLMTAMALVANFLIGYGSRGTNNGTKLLAVLPLVVAIAFMLIADIDTPKRGLIHVVPQNLLLLVDAIKAP
jgi:hypothetical protein